jgi:Carboxypeptidase regulatory-like domain
MTRLRIGLSTLLAFLLAAFLPAAASAQSAIAGVVKDTTGAVLPGVTVEASSDVLIEKMRSVVTDDQGQYKIVDLRPGIYTITFTLSGFNTFRREGVELPAEFTATINADLRVGAIEETVTVSGESPIVDVQTTVHTQVLSRDLLDALPSGRTIQGVGQLVIGVTLNLPDVGGSRAMQQTYMTTHGMTASQNTVMVDGMMVNGLQTDGQVQSYFNEAMSQEVSYQTAAIGAETSAGGVRLNMIPREGGNRFSGSFFGSWRDGAWQGDNLTQRLIDRGLTRVGKIDRIYDFNAAEGGPIKRDKLWFFATARIWSVDAPIADTVRDDGSQGIDDQRIKSALLRLTWQISPRNKLAAYFDEIDKYRGHAMIAGDDPETASVPWGSPAYNTGQIKWTSTVSNRLLVESGYSRNLEYYTNGYQPGVAKLRGTPQWFATASRMDRDLVTRTTASANQLTQSPERHNVQASASYVTGSHNFKTGFQLTWGDFVHTRDANADLVQEYRTGKPDTVLVRNTPYRSAERLNRDFGVYGQDQWTFKRLTINAGLRWEHVNAEIPPQESPAGRFVSARKFARIPDLPNWSDWAPRFGAVYDLFGNAKTALKFSLNRYNRARTTGIAETYNPLDNTTQRLRWMDLNGDDIAQDNEIDLASLSPNFGTVALNRYDPDTKREFNFEKGIELQHQLLPRMSVTASWNRGDFYNLTLQDNLLVSLSDWTPIQVFNPINGSPLVIHDVLAAKRGQVDRLDTNAPNRTKQYESFGLQVNVRLVGGATLFGGAGWARVRENRCDEPDNPNLIRFCDEFNFEEGFRIPYERQIKLAGSYALPWGIQLGASFQSNQGAPTNLAANQAGANRDYGGISWLLTRTATYPAICPACPNGVAPWAPNQLVLPTLNGTPTEANLQVRLTPFNTEFHDRINQLDLRVAKSFDVGAVRLQPQLEAFNVFNQAPIITYRSFNFGTPAYQQPSVVLQGRIIGVGIQVRW